MARYRRRISRYASETCRGSTVARFPPRVDLRSAWRRRAGGLPSLIVPPSRVGLFYLAVALDIPKQPVIISNIRLASVVPLERQSLVQLYRCATAILLFGRTDFAQHRPPYSTRQSSA